MCEFCTKHGEGKKWYLEMKNYAEELLHEDLSTDQQGIAKAATRLEWTNRFWRNFVMPALGVRKEPGAKTFTATSIDEAKVEHFGQVLPIEDVEHVIDMVDSITRMPCGCRYLTTGKTDRRYCFGIAVDKWGLLGEFPDATASLEVLDKETTKKILREYDEEGLIHSIWTGISPYVVGICNCDRDCLPYKMRVEKGGPATFFKAEYICRIDPDLCTGCKACISQCQFGAEFYSSALGKVYIDPTRCWGCGVCRAVCPTDAIELIPRKESPKAADLWE